MEKMKVLMVSHVFPPQFAGAAVQGIYLSHALKKLGIQPDFFTDNGKAPSRWDDYEGLRVFRARTMIEHWSQKKQIAYTWRLFWFLAAHPEYRLLHFHSMVGFEALIFPLLRLMGRRPMVELTLVGNDDPLTLKKRKLGFLFHPGMMRASQIVPISTRLQDLSLEAGIKKESLTLIPVGVDTSKFFALPLAEKEALKTRLGYAAHPTVFLAVGQLEERKGYEFMVEAWKSISARMPEAVLLIAGPKNQPDNPYFIGLQKMIEQGRIANIHFLGRISNVSDYMKIADCLLHCALAEGLPNTLLEAGVSSVPIVCRHIEGVTSDILFSQAAGKEYKGDRPEEFAETVVRFMKERDLESIRKASREIQARFDIQSVAKRYKELYQKLLN